MLARNEGNRLIPFLRHYRKLGVTSFFVVDDQSTDGTLDLLLSEPDVRAFTSNVRFGEAKLGEHWRQILAERIGLDR